MNSISKFNVGDKVRVTKLNHAHLPVGTIGEVQYDDGQGVRLKEGGYLAYRRIELVAPKQTKKRRIEALEKDVARQETELEELRAKIEAFEQKAKSAVWLSDAMRKATKETATELAVAMERKLFKALTPNQRRAQIIADAKKFVEQTIEDARDEDGDLLVPDSTPNRSPWYCREIKYEINAEKRTVVALATAHYDGKVVEKAIAKCAPDDVFNADIGKAIAVGRLFGLDVERFVYAPKPTEIVVGQRVVNRGRISLCREVRVPGAFGSDGLLVEFVYGSRDDGYTWFSVKDTEILDDTEAQYE